MKITQFKTSIISAFRSNTNKTVTVLMMAAFTFCAFNTMYGKNKSTTNERNSSNSSISEISTPIEWVNLKGHTDNQSDLLQWEVLNTSNIAYFTIECSKSEDMAFNEVASINPLECVDMNKNACFAFKCANNDEQGTAYYKVKVTYQDNHTIESNFILIKKTENTAALNISEIKNQGGQITLSFKSPKNQNITLNILNRAGQLLAAKNINASEGENTILYDASFIHSSEMLIFSLNNQEEQTTKKYMLASAW